MKASIAIPCYEMGGWSDSFLRYSLDILKNQTFKDFEIVVSDHSIDDKIKNLCSQYKDLDIKYIRNENKRGSSSANINNCILNSSGKLIKVLCQDDYLYGDDAIDKTVRSFSYGGKWFVGSYYHTRNRHDLINLHIPKINDSTFLENNIGTHSCLTILNEEPILFDENLLWFMDCEYYHRLFLRYGFPEILEDPTVVQFLWTGQVTNTLINQKLVDTEVEYIKQKYESN
jgi:glycosyltransferase involved in cell wall biosynthesis